MIHHVGIVAADIYCNRALHLLQLASNDSLHLIDTKEIPQWSCFCYLYKFERGSFVELVVPYGGKLREWLGEHGPNSLHHVAVQVPNLQQATERLLAGGAELISETPVEGVGGMLVNFVHPIYAGVMLEIVEVQPNGRSV